MREAGESKKLSPLDFAQKTRKIKTGGIACPLDFAQKNAQNQNRGVTAKCLRVFIRTFGCQMNERDSEIICSMMMQEGYAPAQSYEDASLIIFNTCSVRKHAEDRVWGKLTELKDKEICPPSFAGAKLSRGATSPPQISSKSLRGGTRPHKKIVGLVGCMGKAYGKEIFKRLPHVDFVCGPANIYDIPALVNKVLAGKTHVAATGKNTRPLKKRDGTYREENIRAWVNISYGCDNFCSYCIVPYVRGREISRSRKDIIDEIKQLVDNGTKEVTLLGQNVNSYKFTVHGSQFTDNNDFVMLLEEVNKIKGLERIRFMTSHPKDAGIELFKAIAGLDKVCEHLHLPMQSGSDRILKLMNRGYTCAHYLKLIDGVRKVIPDCAITTDVIVGFPSESEKDFKDTYEMMQKIKFDSAFIFKYSTRPFTKASQMKDDVSMEAKKERNHVLLNLQAKISERKTNALIGNIENVLGLSIAKKKPDSSNDLSATYIKARTRKNYQAVCKGGKALIGKIFDIKIKDIQDNTLIGDII
jgi:tRNA-2-methylthio-N6-dimethylallyladenosine synthase